MSSLPPLTMQFFDVGQGDGTFIVFPNGATMLVDLGSTKNKRVTGPDVRKYLVSFTKFAQKRQTLDYLVLTHGDSDHYNMVKDTVEQLDIGVANLLCGGDGGQAYTDLKAWLCLTNPNGTATRLYPPNTFPVPLPGQFGGAEVWILAWNTWSNRSQQANFRNEWSRNTDSIVLSISYERVRVLLAGDATVDTERAILADLDANKVELEKADVADLIVSDVLKVGHHGSRRTSNSVTWIKAVQPEFVFISGDRHGSLDPDNDDAKKTGHRLPQRLTTDLIKKYAPLYDGCDLHSYVTAYDVNDYTNYDKAPDNPPNEKIGEPQFGKYRGTQIDKNQAWIEEKTELAIFTTLAQMDVESPDGSSADQGAQYEVAIDLNGITVKTTLDSSPVEIDKKKARKQK